MTSDRTAPECIRVIAEDFGWPTDTDPTSSHCGSILVPLDYGFVDIYPEHIRDRIVFLACVRVELAKRGWRPYGHSRSRAAMWRSCDNAWSERTAPHPYDPTDLADTTLAELRAAAEAVEVMRGREG